MSGYHNSSRLVVAANDGNLREVTILLAIDNPLTSEKTRALRQACVPYTRVTVPVWRMPVLRQGQHLAIVRELLRRGAVLDQLQRGTGTRRYDSAFLYDVLRSSTPSIVRVLHQNGLDFSTRDRDGKSISEEALKPSNWAHNVNSSMTNRRLLETWGEMSDLVAGNRGNAGNAGTSSGTRGTSGGSRSLGSSGRSRNGSRWEQAPSYAYRPPRNAGAAVRMYSRASGVPLGSRVVSGNFTNAAMGMRTDDLNNTANSSRARAPPNALYIQGDRTRSLFTLGSLRQLANHPLTRAPIVTGSVRRARRAPVTPVTSRTARTAPKRKRNSM